MGGWDPVAPPAVTRAEYIPQLPCSYTRHIPHHLYYRIVTDSSIILISFMRSPFFHTNDLTKANIYVNIAHVVGDLSGNRLMPCICRQQ